MYGVEDIVKLLLHPNLNTSRYVCTKVPTSISESVSFIVDLDQLESQKDVLSDDMGAWKNNGVDTTYVRVAVSKEKVKKVVKCSHTGSYSVKRIYRTHGTDTSLKKLTTFMYGEFQQ